MKEGTFVLSNFNLGFTEGTIECHGDQIIEQNYKYLVSVQYEHLNYDFDILPLIVIPKEDVKEEVNILCEDNIKIYSETGLLYELSSEEPITKIPVGTKAGEKIKFNCLLDPNDIDYYIVYIEALFDDWDVDLNKRKIQLSSQFFFTLNSTRSKNLKSGDKILLLLFVTLEVKEEIIIKNGTFQFVNKTSNFIVSNLINCDKIALGLKIGKYIIQCTVSNDISNGIYTFDYKYSLKFNGLEIDDIDILFIDDDNLNNKENENTNKNDNENNEDFIESTNNSQNINENINTNDIKTNENNQNDKNNTISNNSIEIIKNTSSDGDTQKKPKSSSYFIIEKNIGFIFTLLLIIN